MLGAQTPFEHGTHADKFIYEAELRTGMGAHFRYAEHLSAALGEFFKQVPEAKAVGGGGHRRAGVIRFFTDFFGELACEQERCRETC